jgi:DNA polymerase-3 subunit epsilon
MEGCIVKILYFDVETTGIDPNQHGIVQLAQIIEIDGKVVDYHSWNIQPFPADVVDPKAIAVHGIGEMVKMEGSHIHEDDKVCVVGESAYRMQSDQAQPQEVWHAVKASWKRWINPYNRNDKFVSAGYNIQAFDIPFLRRWIARCEPNSRFSVAGSYLGRRNLDPLPMMQWLVTCGVIDDDQLPNLKLGTVCDAFGIKLGDAAHDALADVVATRTLIRRMQDWLFSLGRIPSLEPVAGPDSELTWLPQLDQPLADEVQTIGNEPTETEPVDMENKTD